MDNPLWQLQIGMGVIDCAVSSSKKVVIAGDVNGDVVVMSYDGKEQATYSYPMPVWGVDISEDADTFAVGLASKTPSKGGFIVVRQSTPILEKYIETAVWDVKIIDERNQILASTWGEGLYQYDLSSAKLEQVLNGKDIFGISRGANEEIFLTVSGEGIYSGNNLQAYDLIAHSRVACYNNVFSKGRVIYGSSSNLLSVLDTKSGAEKHYKSALKSPCAIEVANDNVLIGDLDGNLIICKEDHLTIPIFYKQFDGGIWNITWDADNSLVFIACGDGSLYCYEFDIESIKKRPVKFLDNIASIKSVLNGTKVFISYAREDIDVVRLLYDSLTAAGCEAWVDFNNLLPGQNWKSEIKSEIKSCDFFVLCLSKHSSSKRGFVQKEIKEALEILELMPDGRIFLIPIRLDECNVPESLSDHHYVDLFAEDGLTKLLMAMCYQKMKAQ
jgi:WD40 repeat protein